MDDDEYLALIDRDEPLEATCNRCGKSGLEWSDTTGRWVLLNEMGEPHKCNPAALRKAVADDFED